MLTRVLGATTPSVDEILELRAESDELSGAFSLKTKAASMKAIVDRQYVIYKSRFVNLRVPDMAALSVMMHW